MKIIIIGPAHPLRGGLATFNERMARTFQELGDQVSIYTFSLQYPAFLFPGKTQFSEATAPKGLDIKVVINSINPLSWWKTGREISRLRPDLVICRFWLPFMGPCLGSILRLIRRNGHTRIIGLIDNIVPHEKRPGDFWLAKYFADAVDGFLVMSRSTEEEMKRFVHKQSVRYEPHPMFDTYGEKVAKPEARAHLQLDASGRYILFFGFIRDYKGLDLLLLAMTDERIQALGIRLIVAGEFYANEEKYRNLIRDAKLESVVRVYADFIPNDEVRYYFGAADLVVQPYKSATQSGISQIAYYFDKPMVVTNVGGLPEIVPDGEAGYVVAPDPTAIADALVNFYEKDREEAFIQGVIREKKRFSWEHLAETIKSL